MKPMEIIQTFVCTCTNIVRAVQANHVPFCQSEYSFILFLALKVYVCYFFYLNMSKIIAIFQFMYLAFLKHCLVPIGGGNYDISCKCDKAAWKSQFQIIL